MVGFDVHRSQARSRQQLLERIAHSRHAMRTGQRATRGRVDVEAGSDATTERSIQKIADRREGELTAAHEPDVRGRMAPREGYPPEPQPPGALVERSTRTVDEQVAPGLAQPWPDSLVARHAALPMVSRRRRRAPRTAHELFLLLGRRIVDEHGPINALEHKQAPGRSAHQA